MTDKLFNDNVNRWARLRFSIIGGLLANPPQHGQLNLILLSLASQRWRHPTKEGESIQFDMSTIERWYYRARNASDPLSVLGRKGREDCGKVKVIKNRLIAHLKAQYQQHPDWSYQLHHDNLDALVCQDPELGPMPSYSTLWRLMNRLGFKRRKKLPQEATVGQQIAAERLLRREVRSYEVPYVHGLWHLDFHHGRRHIIDHNGRYHIPRALCILDDCSRLCCHIQWYIDETARSLIHGITQAFYKRGLPRMLLTDNGSAMLSHEFRNGLERLGILHELTLAYSPYQNGKQETLWGQLEGRLMKMLSDVEPLTLKTLNDSTQAWAEMEYNRKSHRSLSMSPLDRMQKDTTVARNSPRSDEIELAFCNEIWRTQRRSDGTITIDGVRFEVPWQYNHLKRVKIRYKSWDMSVAYLVDPRNGTVLSQIVPLNKTANADSRRRRIEQHHNDAVSSDKKSNELPALLQKYMQEYAATGLPPAYIPLQHTDMAESITNNEETHHV